MTIKVMTVVGARPQFIKAAAVSRAIQELNGEIREVMVHTGQHFDDNMSAVFFDELQIPVPAHNLHISSGSHGAMTGRMLIALEEVMQSEKPDYVLIYGDTNSTLAAALAASKLGVAIAHVEAGLRSYNMVMPEEINRILSDRVSKLLLCPTEQAVRNLASEGINEGVHNVGDVMFDVALFVRERARTTSGILRKLLLTPGEFILATCHRQENTDNPGRLSQIIDALSILSQVKRVVLPLHPRTRKLLDGDALAKLERVTLVEPLGFYDMVALEQAAQLILTDSGGVQKEAFFYQVPCVTMRDETEWVETVDLGWNTLVGADSGRICSAVEKALGNPETRIKAASPYGDGKASAKIVSHLLAR